MEKKKKNHKNNDYVLTYNSRGLLEASPEQVQPTFTEGLATERAKPRIMLVLLPVGALAGSAAVNDLSGTT